MVKIEGGIKILFDIDQVLSAEAAALLGKGAPEILESRFRISDFL
jgi:hypothetical protein